MTASHVLRLRLCHQRISRAFPGGPADVVREMVAMQAQEYAMAKWAVGLRLPRATDGVVEAAFNRGEILRTHVLRPTWHFVAPEDIRWLLRLTAPRVRAASGFMHRQLELDVPVFRRAEKAVVRALEERSPLKREALQAALADAGIAASGPRLAYLVMHAELEGLVCSGPREGRRFTYMLLDQRAPRTRELDRPAALAELARCYFATRGPATPRDLAYWLGLSMADAKAGAESLGRAYERETIDGQLHYFKPAATPPLSSGRATFLMPDYDEYGMSYKDRSALGTGAIVFNRMLIVDGRIVGTWKSACGNAEGIEMVFNAKLAGPQKARLNAAIARFRAFVK